MTEPDVARWIATHCEGVPPALRAAMERALAAVPGDGSRHGVLRRAAEMLVADVRDGPASDDAVTLLAADALITYLCEAVSEHDPASLADLT